MKTRALREAAERARAAAFGPIPVRVHFPDGLILQAAFSALDPLSKLHVGREEEGERKGRGRRPLVEWKVIPHGDHP